jgi:hypothetical protein
VNNLKTLIKDELSSFDFIAKFYGSDIFEDKNRYKALLTFKGVSANKQVWLSSSDPKKLESAILDTVILNRR